MWTGWLSGLAHINFHERDRGNVSPGPRTGTFSKLVAAEMRIILGLLFKANIYANFDSFFPKEPYFPPFILTSEAT